MMITVSIWKSFIFSKTHIKLTAQEMGSGEQSLRLEAENDRISWCYRMAYLPVGVVGVFNC
jgi:hypothetical protein